MKRDDLRFSGHPDVYGCTRIDGETTADHDYRPFDYDVYGIQKTALRCIWCHAQACGSYGEDDPCIEPRQHFTPHRTRSGVTWGVGAKRPVEQGSRK